MKDLLASFDKDKMNTAIFIALCTVSSLCCLTAAEPVAEIQRAGLVYILRQAGSNFYKVGLTSGSVSARIKQLQTGNPNKISEVFSQKVKDVGQAEKAAKDAVKKYHAHPKYQGGMEWYEVPSKETSSFINTIKGAISRFRSQKMMLLEQAIAQMFNQE